MEEKRFKVKFENGKIIPLEPINISEIKEGILIFFDFEKKNNLLKHSNKWVGDDFEECLKEVYDARGKAEF